MLKLNQLAGFGAGGGSSPFLLDIISELGLNSNLNLVLDAADLRSYDGSSQTWTDISGGSNNFIRGTTTGADATDPTFVGVAGDGKDTTYFSFDGGDYFTESAAHTFADNWHKNNGAFSIVAVVYFGSAASDNHVFSNATANVSNTDGISFAFGIGTAVFLQHSITNTTDATDAAVTATTLNLYHFCGVSFDEATAATKIATNSTIESFTTSASTNTDPNANPLRIGTSGNVAALTTFANTMRLACLAAWSTPIGSAALSNLYTLLKARRFTTMP